MRIIKIKPWRFNLDTDNDGVLDYKDCRPFDPDWQHSQAWENSMLKKERFRADFGDLIEHETMRGWSESKAIARVRKNVGSNLSRLIIRHERVNNIPDATGFDGEDIRRTKDVIEYIKEHKLKDLGSEIRF